MPEMISSWIATTHNYPLPAGGRSTRIVRCAAGEGPFGEAGWVEKPVTAKLELEFRRICDGSNQAGKMPNLDIRFMDKKHNSTGLQFADLVAQPIARRVITSDRPNRAYDIIEKEIQEGQQGQRHRKRSENLPLKSERPRLPRATTPTEKARSI
jgi:hypothetical protein